MIDKSNQSYKDNPPAPKLPSNFNVLTFTAACPSCGAPVEFASPGSVMAVCEYCQTTVLRDGEALKAQGKQSLTIEDYSPIQIGSVGSIDGTDFAVIGRVQLQYGQGVWNEWYLQFADGRIGWLSEALGLYTLTLGEGEKSNLPAYDNLAINDSISFEGINYQVSDRREAYAIAGEGELPFIVGEGWQTWVIDARYKRKLISLDYAQSGSSQSPVVHKGEAIEFAALNFQLLKEDRQLNEQVTVNQAGAMGQSDSQSKVSDKASGNSVKISKIECPNCGSPMPYVAGATEYLVCPACHSESKLTGSTAKLVAMHSTMQHFDSSLPLGAKARIAAEDIVGVSEFALTETQRDAAAQGYHDYVVIGIMRLQEVGEFASWTEYLLYSLTDGFLWLSEESRGWFVARVLSEMPVSERGQLHYDDRQWRQVDSGYRNRVTFAMGAFNWQVKTDDSDLLIDYTSGDEVITSEQTEREITYTHAIPLPYHKLEQWFGSYLQPENTHERSGFSEEGSLKKMLTWHAILQIAVWLLAGGSIIVGIIGAILIYIIYFRASEAEKDYVSAEVETGPFNYHSAGTQGISVVIIVLALIVSFMMGVASKPSPTGPNPDEESATRGGGGIIIIPGGVGGGSNNNGSNGRTGYSSGGAHK
ncbi:DUF4178 domain-containing protein [Psychrobacter phenylpyruvicus]|uniref:DUF4178 domain-containing protein n=1 Tax=Psychrobacter phenylpyruvicus TaxID=29432 RepID=A0A379LLA8_9GAMM|nr:DUF4178 domain-containing protein [Psychrobacter phenylpyruvicus]SUD90915.1 Uncharacterised protein [Psychrobacter phenylpyruvicus]